MNASLGGKDWNWRWLKVFVPEIVTNRGDAGFWAQWKTADPVRQAQGRLFDSAALAQDDTIGFPKGWVRYEIGWGKTV